MILSLVVARSENGIIGRDNGLPWSLPADLQHFRRVTLGHAIIMGRRTHESIGKPLPGRQNIIMSRDPHYRAEGCTVVSSWIAATACAPDSDELMVVGGESLYRMALPEAQKIYLTEVHAKVEGTARFPDLDPSVWRERQREFRPADPRNEFDCSFVLFVRAGGGI